nr:ubiquitin hydrolase [Tanacetum cinerariifolium]
MLMLATKKTKRNLLKQQYENFTTPRSEMIDQNFDRLQNLVSQLEFLEEKLSQEDADEGPNYAIMDFSSSSSDSKLRTKAKSSKEEPKVVRKNDDALIIEEWMSNNKEEDVSQPKIKKKKTRPGIAKIEFVKSKQQEKTARKTVKQVKQYRLNTYSPRGNKRNWNSMMSQKLRRNFEMFNKACYDNPQMDLQDQGVIDGGCSRQKQLVLLAMCKIKCSGPDWLFDIDALTRTMNYEPIVAGTQSNGFPDPKSFNNDGSKPSSDDGKKVDEDIRK